MGGEGRVCKSHRFEADPPDWRTSGITGPVAGSHARGHALGRGERASEAETIHYPGRLLVFQGGGGGGGGVTNGGQS